MHNVTTSVRKPLTALRLEACKGMCEKLWRRTYDGIQQTSQNELIVGCKKTVAKDGEYYQQFTLR